MGWLLIALATVEAILKARRRRLLSHQRGWQRVLIFGAWGAFGAHLVVEAARTNAAERAARAWAWQ